MKRILITTLLTLSSCGSDAPSSAPPVANVTSKPTEANEAALATGKCDVSPLSHIPAWQVQPYDQDTIVVGKNCVFQSFYCESLGHIDSDLGTAEVGIAKITITYEGRHNPGCLGVGEFQCQYQASNGFDRQLYLTCQ